VKCSNCSSLKTIDISNFNTQNVENMGNMFWKCSSLEDLNLSNFNIQNVKDMSGMFSRCSSLKSLNLSNFRGSDNLKDMNGMFSHCISLINLDLSNCDTKNVENIKDIFADCSSLKNLNISNFNTNKVKNIDGIFRNCKELNINSIKTKDLRILNIMKYDYSNLIGIEDKLNYNNSLNKIGYNKNDDNNNNYIIGELYISRKDINKNMRIISSYEEMCRKFGSEIKEQYKNEKEIKECIIEIDGKKLQPFSYYHKFKSEGNYTIIYYFKNILSSCSALFSECSCLTYLDLSNFNTKNSIYMDSMFYGCNSLKNVDLSNLNTVKVIDMHSMFQNCSSLINLDLSNLNTENVTNIHSMFAGCSSLTHLDLSNFNLKQKVKDFRDVASLLMGCNSLNINGIVTNEPNILNEIVLGQLFKTATNPTNCGIF
jgi:surface protein